MSLTTTQQRKIFESVLDVYAGKENKSVNDKEESIEEVSEETFDLETFVGDFISSALATENLSESSEEDIQTKIIDIVDSVNFTCSALNEFFGVGENVLLAPAKGKGRGAAKKLYSK